MTSILNVEEFKKFCNVYWSHPYFLDTPDPHIRLAFLPSEYLKKNSGGNPVDLRNNEVSVRRSEIQSTLEENETLKRLNGRIQQGWDCYYFAQFVPIDIPGHAKSLDVAQYLHVCLDLDFSFRAELEDVVEKEFDAKALIVQSSSRKEGKRFQALIQITPEDGIRPNVERCRLISQRIQHAFGSDPVHDPKRIMRLPGSVNWKKVHAGEPPTRCRIVNRDEVVLLEAEGLGSLEKLVGSFELSESSEILRLAGYKAVNVGGKREAPRRAGSLGNTFGKWSDALEKLEDRNALIAKGEKAPAFIIPRGNRTNALISWCGQMAMEGIHPDIIKRNITRLATQACEEGYQGDERDLANIIKRGFEWREKEDALIAAVLNESFDEEPNCIEDIIPELPGYPAPDLPPYENGATSIPAPPPPPPVNPTVLPEPLPREKYIQRMVKRCSDQTESAWHLFLAQAAIMFAHSRRKDVGSFRSAENLITDRLDKMGLRWGRFYSLPSYHPVNHVNPLPHWSLAPLDEDGARSTWRLFVQELCNAVNLEWKMIAKHPFVLKRIDKDIDKDGSAVKLRFSAKGSFLSDLITGIISRGNFNKKVGREISSIILQNGEVRLDGCTNKNAPIEKIFHKGEQDWNVEGVCTSAPALNSPGAIAASWVGHIEGFSRVRPERFEKFLLDAFPGDDNKSTREELIPLIIGYSLLPNNPLQKMFSFAGATASGKSTLARIIAYLAGPANVGHMQFVSLAKESGLGVFEFKSVIVLEEAEASDRRVHNDAVATLKRATGGETISVRSLFGDERDATINAKFILTSNEAFKFDDTSRAVNRRIVPVHFAHPKPNQLQDSTLAYDIVRAEGNLIATLAIQKLAQCWYRRGGLFQVEGSRALDEGREQFSADTAPIDTFVERCIKPDGKDIPQSLLVACLNVWFTEENKHKPSGRFTANVQQSMARFGFEYAKNCETHINDKRYQFRGFRSCQINPIKMLDLLELDEAQFIKRLKDVTIGDSSIHEFCRVYLGLDMLFGDLEDETIQSELNF